MEKSAIYRCPRCSKRTCSLPCVRQHKEDSKCSGQGQHTNTPAFVSKECFSEAMMHDGRCGVVPADILSAGCSECLLLICNKGDGNCCHVLTHF